MNMINLSNELRGHVIVGHGVDIVDISDFNRLFTEKMLPFLNRNFTETEIANAGVGVNRVAKLAGRFAVKEAVLKALGIGWGDGIAFTDVEVITLETGAPTVRLYRRLAELETKHQIVDWLVSTSHTSFVAFASVIALRSVDGALQRV